MAWICSRLDAPRGSDWATDVLQRDVDEFLYSPNIEVWREVGKLELTSSPDAADFGFFSSEAVSSLSLAKLSVLIRVDVSGRSSSELSDESGIVIEEPALIAGFFADPDAVQ